MKKLLIHTPTDAPNDMEKKNPAIDNNCSLLVQVTILKSPELLHKYQHACSVSHVLPCHDQGLKARNIEDNTAVAVKKRITKD